MVRGEPQNKETNDRSYALSQEQRRLERQVRYAKREAAAMNATGDKEGFGAAAQRVKRAQSKYTDFVSSSGRTKRNDRTQVFGYNKSVAGKVTEAAKQKVTTLSIREKRTASGRYSVSQQKIDSLTSGKLSGINTPVPVTYNARLRCNGKTTAELYQWGAVKRITKIEVGAQDRESEGFLVDTILHEALEAKIMLRSGKCDKYAKLNCATDDVRHKYINSVIKRYMRIRGWNE